MSTKSLLSVCDELLNAGYIAINFCSNESAATEEISHYSLLKPGEEINPSCTDELRIPLISEEGKAILQDFIDDKAVRIHPDPLHLS